MARGQRGPEGNLAHHADELLSEHDGEQRPMSDGVPDHGRVRDVPHQEEDAEGLNHNRPSYPAKFEAPDVGPRIDDEGERAPYVDQEHGADSNASEPDAPRLRNRRVWHRLTIRRDAHRTPPAPPTRSTPRALLTRVL